MQNPKNPWVSQAYDISVQLEELEVKIADYSKQYEQHLKVQKKAKTIEEIKSAFDRGDRLMNAVVSLSRQRRQLIGGAA